MWLFSLISFLILGGYLLLCAMRFGVPDMVSDTYYQLQGTTGSTIIGSNRKRNFGWLFSVVMVVVAVLMMIAILDLNKGIQCLAFIGCAGLAFVGCAPNYLDDDSKVHKVAAIIAALGCVVWCISVHWLITLLVALSYALAMMKVNDYNRLGKFHNWERIKYHPWYWAEVSAFLNVFITYWMCCL